MKFINIHHAKKRLFVKSCLQVRIRPKRLDSFFVPFGGNECDRPSDCNF